MNFLDVLFPRRCLGCGKLGAYFCPKCTASIRMVAVNESICPICEKPAIDGATHPRCRSRYTIDGLTSFFHYEKAVRKAIRTMKYQYVSDLANELVGLVPADSLVFLTKLLSARRQNSFLIPLPLHPSRLRWRGFNQTQVLGRYLSQRLGISMRPDTLKRIRSTTPQVEVKNRQRRLKNMEGVFCVNASAKDTLRLSGLVFDDVFTTGATLRSAASVLKRAGVPFVWGVTMAR